MKYKTPLGVIGVLAFMAGGAVWLQARQLRPSNLVMQVQPTPVVGTPTATPNPIVVNTPTQVTVTVQILDPRLVSGGVNLLRLSPTGTQSSILGVMRDDGINGDQAANDKVFTIRIILTEGASGQIRTQVSAAFAGTLKRVLS